MQKPSLREALAFWTRLGFISFGGPAGQIAIMHDYLVEKRRWISEQRFLHALNYCMLLPGPEAQQLATYTGWLLHGRLGGLAAGILFVLPSMFILWGLSTVYVLYGDLPSIDAMFRGIQPAVLAVIVLALIRIGSRALQGWLHYLVALGAFVGLFVLGISFPLLMLGLLLLAFAGRKAFPSLFHHTASAGHGHGTKTEKETGAHDPADYVIGDLHPFEPQPYPFRAFFRTLIIALLVWAAPLFLVWHFAADSAFWTKLISFFTQAAFVTFGGAYAVLPYVAQVSVEQLGWLSSTEMVDGMALGESTPGPLVMVLAFVGYMAGYNHFDGSVAMGTAALLLTTLYTFIPCFVFIFAGAPLIERTRENPSVRQALSLVTAGVVGVIANLAIYLGKAILISPEATAISFSAIQWPALFGFAISLAALYRFKVNLLLWLGISAAAGLLFYLLV